MAFPQCICMVGEREAEKERGGENEVERVRENERDRERERKKDREYSGVSSY